MKNRTIYSINEIGPKTGGRSSIAKMDRFDRTLILSWIDKKLVGCTNPRQFDKGLTGNHATEWRYRVGDYRIIVDIQDNKVVILVLIIGHHSEIYTTK